MKTKFKVTSDAMCDNTSRSILIGDVIEAQPIKINDVPANISAGVFVIQSEGKSIIRQITRVSDGEIKCRAFNPNYDDEIIPIDRIERIFLSQNIKERNVLLKL
ncbi:MAG: hypothetical protein Q4G63_10060 [Bacteroidia bacterium]|nr:hypothetical protein [Bacteroidia bacterium]